MTLKNSGTVAADEVFQLYLSGVDICTPAPLYQLIAFRRVRLKPGQVKTIRISIPPEMLMLFDDDGRQKFVPGKYKLIAGGCSPGSRGVELGTSQPVCEEFLIS